VASYGRWGGPIPVYGERTASPRAASRCRQPIAARGCPAAHIAGDGRCHSPGLV